MTVTTQPTKAQLETIGSGMVMEGVFVQPEWVMPIVGDPAGRHRIRIVVSEGRNHEVSLSGSLCSLFAHCPQSHTKLSGDNGLC